MPSGSFDTAELERRLMALSGGTAIPESAEASASSSGTVSVMYSEQRARLNRLVEMRKRLDARAEKLEAAEREVTERRGAHQVSSRLLPVVNAEVAREEELDAFRVGAKHDDTEDEEGDEKAKTDGPVEPKVLPPQPVTMKDISQVGNDDLGLEYPSQDDMAGFSDTSLEAGESDEGEATPPKKEKEAHIDPEPTSPAPTRPTTSPGSNSADTSANSLYTPSNIFVRGEVGLQNMSFASSEHPDSDPERDVSFAPWRPPQFVLDYHHDGDPIGGVSRYDPGLVLKTVMVKPDGIDEKIAAVREQGGVCANTSCGKKLVPTFSPLRMGKNFDHARFCYYTGYYYCEDCHPRDRLMSIPARMVQDWDFTQLPVCNPVADLLDLHHDEPIIHLSSVNPALVDEVALLRAAMKIRSQLQMLVELGSPCPKFCELFFGPEIGATGRPKPSSGSPLGSGASSMFGDSSLRLDRSKAREIRRREAYGKETTVIPLLKRYLVESGEFWSIADLMEVHEGQPQKVRKGSRLQNSTAAQAKAASCPMIVFLKTVRTQMVKHIVQNCRASCFQRGVKICPLCKDPDKRAFVFDINEVWQCPRCKSAYHRRCMENPVHKMPAGTCKVCTELSISRGETPRGPRGPSPTSSKPKKRSSNLGGKSLSSLSLSPPQ